MLKPFDPKGYLDVARELADGTTNEAKLRAAVGRLYYGVFLLIRGVVHVGSDDPSQHKSVKAAVSRRDLLAGARYGSLYDLRIEADYYCDQPKDPAYDDWKRNWRDAEAYATEILTFFGIGS